MPSSAIRFARHVARATARPSVTTTRSAAERKYWVLRGSPVATEGVARKPQLCGPDRTLLGEATVGAESESGSSVPVLIVVRRRVVLPVLVPVRRRPPLRGVERDRHLGGRSR